MAFFSKWMRCRDGESRQRWLRDVCVLCRVSCLQRKINAEIDIEKLCVHVRGYSAIFFGFWLETDHHYYVKF